jgi:polyketide biosynthesis enoyl-CoA hydratase PksI
MSALSPRSVAPGVVSIAVSADDDPHFAWQPQELAGALAEAVADPASRVILLEGGRTYFSAGGTRQLLVGEGAQDLVPAFVAELPRVLLDVELPMIAVAAGHAVGGGFAMTLCCDIILLAEESLYGANFVSLGFTPGMGSTVLLAEAVGEPLAREMLFTGRLMKGREIAHAGGPLAHAVYPRAQIRERALQIAGEIAEVPRPTLVELKRLILARRRAALDGVLERERTAQIGLLGMEQIRTRIAAAYGGPSGGDHE